jgi:hypothetical protein
MRFLKNGDGHQKHTPSQLREKRAALEVPSHLVQAVVVAVSTADLEERFLTYGFIAREKSHSSFRVPGSSHGFGEKNPLSFTNSHEHFDEKCVQVVRERQQIQRGSVSIRALALAISYYSPIPAKRSG